MDFPPNEQTLISLEAEARQLWSAAALAGDDPTIDRLGQRLDELELVVSETIAETPAGIAAKIRFLWQGYRLGYSSRDENNYLTILESLARLQVERSPEDVQAAPIQQAG